MKQQIRPYYGQLQGILSQTPMSHDFDSVSGKIDSIEFFNKVRDNIQKVMGEDLSDYAIAVRNREFNIAEFRQKVNALIMFLHGKYFPDEGEPFSGSPQTIMNQNQQQNQAINQNRIYFFTISISIAISLVVSVIVNLIIK